MANILLGVTGSVAAIKTPEIVRALQQAGLVVKVVATEASRYFFDHETVPLPRTMVHFDEDEWPGRLQGRRYQREDPVLHIELRRWADLFLIAPLDANTLAKLATGICDNCLSCVWRAWDVTRPVVLAPAMNTLMWQHPMTARHLRQLAEDAGGSPPDVLDLEALPAWINAHCTRLRIVPPESRTLACGDIGVGAMASAATLVQAVLQCL